MGVGPYIARIPAILTEVFRGIFQFLQANARTAFRSGHGYFLPTLTSELNVDAMTWPADSAAHSQLFLPAVDMANHLPKKSVSF